MARKGYVKLHRKIHEWGWWSNPIVLAVWIHLLMDANYAESEFEGRKVMPGQVIIGRKKYAKACGISEQQLRTVLKKLEKTKNLTIKTTNKYTVITIENWEKYQGKRKTPTKSVTNEQPTSNQQATTSKEYKEYIKEGEEIASSEEFIFFKDIM